jgi:hypothetical protein
MGIFITFINKKALLIGLLLVLTGANIFAIANVGFIDIFPTFKLSTSNFYNSNIGRFSYSNLQNGPRLLNGGLNFGYKGWQFYLAIDVLQSVDSHNENIGFSNLPIGHKGAFGGLNVNAPTALYIAYHNDLLDISVGRRRYQFGAGDYSPVLGRDMPYIDGLYVGITPQLTEKGKLAIRFLASADDQAALQRLYDWNRAAWYRGDLNYDYYTNFDSNATSAENEHAWRQTPLGQLETRTRWFFLNKLALIRPTFSVGVTEGLLVAGPNLSAWLGNPVSLWHNTFMPSGTKLLISVDFEKKLGESVRLYGQAMIDDWQLDWELDDVNSPPNTLAIYSGVDWQVFTNDNLFTGPFFNPYAHTLGDDRFKMDGGLILSLQFAWASRYLYNRDYREPLNKFTYFHTQQAGGGGEFFLIENYLGLPYGPDNFLLEATAKWQNKRFYTNSRVGLLFQGVDSASASGFYSQDNWQMQGNFTMSDSVEQHRAASKNWAFSSLANIRLILKNSSYFALSSWASLYFGFDADISIFNKNLTRVTLETGALLRF